MGYPAQSQAGWNKVVNHFGDSISYFLNILRFALNQHWDDGGRET
jgi:hypothetical protein